MTKMQTLICQVGNHEWHRPAQRGKPPRACPDHKVIQNNNGGNSNAHQDTAPKPLDSASSGTSNSASSSVGGVKENPFIAKARRDGAAPKLSTSGLPVRERATGPSRRVTKRNDEQLESDPAHLLEELAGIVEMKKKAEFAYSTAHKQAVKFPESGDVHEMMRLFDIADKQQKRLINVCVAERRVLTRLKELKVEVIPN